MVTFLWNVILALTWASLIGEMSVRSVAVGFVLGFFALWLARPFGKQSRYFRRAANLVRFFAFFTWEVFVSNFRVAWDVVTPRHRARPGIVAYPLEATTDAEITTLAAVISFTPGTVSLEVSQDRTILYIHGMYLEDRDLFVEHIKETFERPLLEVMR